ncbi:MAG TPA: hypothetical protein VH419_16305, partial [Nocardioidaceae bacterium]
PTPNDRVSRPGSALSRVGISVLRPKIIGSPLLDVARVRTPLRGTVFRVGLPSLATRKWLIRQVMARWEVCHVYSPKGV